MLLLTYIYIVSEKNTITFRYYYYYYYGCTALCCSFAALLVPCSYTQSVGLLGRGISPSQGFLSTHKTT
jgi:hypothetical protein